MISEPTSESPLLVGLLVDVSGSMMSAIENKSGAALNRLQGFQAALRDLVDKAPKPAATGETDRLLLFAYGFGFNNPLSFLFGGSGPPVRDLFLGVIPTGESTIGISALSKSWGELENHVTSMAKQMFGATPMLEGFTAVQQRFKDEGRCRRLAGCILFVLSDGAPTDAPPERVVQAARVLKGEGVLIVSCFVTGHDITDMKHLYGQPPVGWPVEAKLMFDVASEVSEAPSLSGYLAEHNWIAEPAAKLFTQVNQSEVLSEFLQMITSPLSAAPASATRPMKRLFVSYSHKDSDWLDRLRVHLSPVTRSQGIDLWDDTRIKTGQLWKKEIATALDGADAAVLLVSADFLASDFIQSEELPVLLRNASGRGTKIFPIVVGPCRYDLSPFSAFQAVNSPTSPLSGLPKAKAEAMLVDLSRDLG